MHYVERQPDTEEDGVVAPLGEDIFTCVNGGGSSSSSGDTVRIMLYALDDRSDDTLILASVQKSNM